MRQRRYVDTNTDELLNANSGDDSGNHLTRTGMFSHAKREKPPGWPEEIKSFRIVIDGWVPVGGCQYNLSDLVQQGDALLGLRYFADPRTEIICSQPVMHEPLQVVSAAHSRLVTGTPTEPLALQGIPWINFPAGMGSSGEPFARLLAQQLLKHGLEDVEIITIDSLTAQKRLIEADFGLGLLPASSIEEELRLGTMQVLPITVLQTTVPVVLIYRCQGYLSRAGRRLREMLTSETRNL